jgi:cell wall-associated protease
MQSGITTNTSVILDGDPSKASPFNKISKSGKMANAYNALILAEQVSKGKIKL